MKSKTIKTIVFSVLFNICAILVSMILYLIHLPGLAVSFLTPTSISVLAVAIHRTITKKMNKS